MEYGVRQEWARVLGILAVLFAVMGMTACGGSSTEGTSDGGSFTGELPADQPGVPTQPPVDDPPPTEEPVDEEPVDEPPPGEPPPDDEPPPGLPPLPGDGKVPPPPDPLPAFDDFPGVHALTYAESEQAWYAIDAAGRLIRWARPEPQPVFLGDTGVHDIRGVAFVPSETALYAVAHVEGADAAVHRIAVPGSEATLVGSLPGFQRVEGLTWHEPSGALFGVADDPARLIRFAPEDPGSVVTVAALGAHAEDPAALASNPGDNVLYVTNGTTGDLVEIDPATGAAERVATFVEGPQRGLAFDPVNRNFLGASAVEPRIQVLDPMGSWMSWARVLALAYDPDADVLYGSFVDHALLIRIERTSGWRQVIGYLAVPDVEGLAWDATRGTLWGVSRTRQELLRIDPATAEVTTIGRIRDRGERIVWTGLSSLTMVDGTLVSVDQETAAALQIDVRDATASELTALAPRGDYGGLAYDGSRRMLHAVTSARGDHVTLDGENGWSQTIRGTVEGRRVGAAVWIPADEVLLAILQVEGTLSEIYRVGEPPLPFDEISGLALFPGEDRILAYDRATTSVVHVLLQGEGGGAVQQLPGTEIGDLAVARDPLVAYGVDNAEGTLWRIPMEGLCEAVQPAGALAGSTFHALAYDSDAEVLWGIQAATHKLVRIDTETMAIEDPFPGLPPMEFEDIRAMDWLPGTPILVAIDRTARRLLEIDTGTGAVTAYAHVEFEAIEGLVVDPETLELLVVDTSLDRILRLDRIDGLPVQPFESLGVNRGTEGDDTLSVLWPRGDLRVDGWTVFAMRLGLDYEGGGSLFFRRGDDVLFQQALEPERVITLGAIPETVRAAVKPGDTVTWGVALADGTEVTADVTIVDRPEVAESLAALAAIPSLRKATPSIRATCTARVLSRHGLHAEALETLVASPGATAAHGTVHRALVTAMRGLGYADTRIGFLLAETEALQTAYTRSKEK